uniref:Uncharacterized protein LOC116953371 isoform X2 n=1 Tax=Petromyzon marinus TaxID=7757 RepID=A0AAJ7U686_PETMA|nr:uncharacterized protein LOC116953371 isoform X2 [Petromyzon marinus]
MPARRGGCEPSAVLIADFEDAGPLTVDVQAELVALFRAQGGRVAWPRVQVEEEEEERGAEEEERGAPPRVAVQFASPEAAARARSALHGTRLPGGGTLQVHAAHAVMGDPESPGASLALPQPGRVWLISPPGSPPAGWQPRPDPAPLVNYDLLCAIAQLGPGQPLSSSSSSLLISYRGRAIEGVSHRLA